MEPNIELLAPAGSAESLRAAVNAGADAVYMGSTRFGARALADNPDEASFIRAMDYAHLHGRKVYLTVNTLLKEEEIKELCNYIKPFYESGIDAVIVQDYGALLLIRKCFPNLSVHASTQMTVTGSRQAADLKSMGVSRIILPRELSLEEIKKISDSVDIELECFIHGALCYCYSGQCLMSSFIGGRSGNRGRCAQPCRLPYSAGNMKDKYLLNMKDLETLKILPDIADVGVNSLKIEGRMKSPRYTAGVVSVYRKYLDLLMSKGRECYCVSESDIRSLLELFDRGGYTSGFFFEYNGKDMTAPEEKSDFRKTDPEYFSSLDEEYVNSVLKIPVHGSIYMHEGEDVSLTVTDLSDDNCSVTVSGATAQKAKTQPLSAGQVIRQMEKTGNSIYEFEKSDCDISGSCFVAVKDLNALRREALAAFEEKCLDKYRRESVMQREKSEKEDKKSEYPGGRKLSEKEKSRKGPDIHVSIEDIKTLKAVLSSPVVKEVYLDSAAIDASLWKSAADCAHRADKKIALILPSIFRTKAEEYFDRNIKIFKEARFDEVIVRSLEEVGYLKEKDLYIPLVFDADIYTWNSAAAGEYKAMGASRLTLPLELNSRELLNLDCNDKELIAYGHVPVMVTAQCVKRNVSECDKKPGCIFMKDRTGRAFPVKNFCHFCCSTIYNPMPLTLLGEEQTVARLDPAVLRLMFTVENPSQVSDIIRAYELSFIRGEDTVIPFKEYTRGHFNRGVV